MPRCAHDNCDKRTISPPVMRFLTGWICPQHLEELWMSLKRTFHDSHQLGHKPRGDTPRKSIEEFQFRHRRGQGRRSV
jgi:hypothetical protein